MKFIQNLIILLFILCFKLTYGQIVKFEFRYEDSFETSSFLKNRVNIYHYSVDNKKLHILAKNNQNLSLNKTIKYYTIDLNNQYTLKENKFIIKERENYPLFSSRDDVNYIKAFWFNDSVCHFATYEGVFKYKLHNDSCSFISVSKYYKGMRKRKSFIPRFFKFDNNELYALRINNPYSSIAKINNISNKIIDYDYISEINFSCPCYNNILPIQHFVTITKKYICVLQTLDYKIDIFDKEMNYIYSLKHTPEKWKALSEKNIQGINEKEVGADCVYYILDLEDKKKNSRIMKIHTIYDNYIVAHGYNIISNHYSFFIDIWDISNPKESKHLTTYNFPMLDENETINEDNLFYYLMGHHNTSKKSLFIGNHVIITEDAIKGISPMNKTRKEYEEEKENGFLEQSPVSRIYVFSIN